jgi:hypothetical protein
MNLFYTIFRCLLVNIIFVLGLNAQTITESYRFYSKAAKQGVAVDDKNVFVIDNARIVKYNYNGDSITQWKAPQGSNIKHINFGFIYNNKLYCAHSNFPKLPMVSSIEIFNKNSMKHCGSISLGIRHGSCTWIYKKNDSWYIFFANYENKSNPNANVTMSELVQFDDQWREQQSWILPDSLIKRLSPNSLSSGVLINNEFYCMGHDACETYVLDIPEYAMILKWKSTIPVPFPGQGISYNAKTKTMWGIDRKKNQVIKATFSPK